MLFNIAVSRPTSAVFSFSPRARLVGVVGDLEEQVQGQETLRLEVRAHLRGGFLAQFRGLRRP